MHNIWIADDDEAIRLVLEESLSSAGFKTKSFNSADDLLKNLDKEQPDLIITDVQMPGMLGYDLLKHINNNYENIPVIVMTAFADMQAAVESFGGGAFEYIPKPFDLEEATEIINRALEDKPKTIKRVQYRLFFFSHAGGTVGVARDWGGAHFTVMEVRE